MVKATRLGYWRFKKNTKRLVTIKITPPAINKLLGKPSGTCQERDRALYMSATKKLINKIDVKRYGNILAKLVLFCFFIMKSIMLPCYKF